MNWKQNRPNYNVTQEKAFFWTYMIQTVQLSFYDMGLLLITCIEPTHACAFGLLRNAHNVGDCQKRWIENKMGQNNNVIQV